MHLILTSMTKKFTIASFDINYVTMEWVPVKNGSGYGLCLVNNFDVLILLIAAHLLTMDNLRLLKATHIYTMMTSLKTCPELILCNQILHLALLKFLIY